jgi:hypothetical protein
MIQVFLKYWHPESLNQLLDKSLYKIIRCQSIVRGHQVRVRYAQYRAVARREAQVVIFYNFFLSLE